MKTNKYPKAIDPKTRKWQRYYRKGKCVICLQKTEVSKNFQEDWCCTPCLITMDENGRKRAAEANLFNRN